MDRFAEGMVARGPTLAADRATWTGSLHIVDLPSADAAQKFVEREPYNRAGLFEEHLIRRFDNLLGRTMWEFREGLTNLASSSSRTRGPERASTQPPCRFPASRPWRASA